jgi:hypothetical protein
VRGWRSCTYSHTASSEGSGIRHCWKTWCQIAVEPLYKELRVSGGKKESKAQLKYVRRQPPDEILLRLFFSGVEKPYQRQSRYRICDYHHMILNNFPTPRDRRDRPGPEYTLWVACCPALNAVVLIIPEQIVRHTRNCPESSKSDDMDLPAIFDEIPKMDFLQSL